MSSKEEINDRILKEIGSLSTDKKNKDFLKDILIFELEIIDKGKPVFRDKYEEILIDIFF